MKDEEIIKALEICAEESDCENCRECTGYVSYGSDCLGEYIRNALDLINHQKAEIERLQKILENRSEICDICTENYTKRIERVKMKAYQELADELKRHCSDIDSDNINAPNVQILWDAEELIDGVLKDMICDMLEEEEDEKNNL
jgi:hypothetical protein